MKKLNVNELRSVEGGYRLICTRCGKTSGSVGPAGLTWFYYAHKHFTSGGCVAYDLSYRGATKWWS